MNRYLFVLSLHFFLLTDNSLGFAPSAARQPFVSSSLGKRTSSPPSSPSTTRLNSVSISALDAFFETSPYLAAFLTCSFKASAADALAQTKAAAASAKEEESIDHVQKEEKEEFDFFRNLAFILYGGFYQGMGQCFLYSHLYPFLFGSDGSLTSILCQAGMENFVMAPFVCLPTVYTIKSLLAGSSVEAGLHKYWDHIFSQQVLLKYWSIWFPVQCFNFGVVPEHLRVPFGACVSFFWVCLLSSISSQEESTTSTDEPARTTASSNHPQQPLFVPVIQTTMR